MSLDDDDDGGHGNGGDDDVGGCNDRGGKHCGVHGHDLHETDMLPVSRIALYVGVIQVSPDEDDDEGGHGNGGDDDVGGCDDRGGKHCGVHGHDLHEIDMLPVSRIALYVGVIQVSPDDDDDDDGGHGNGGDDDVGGCDGRGGKHCGVHGHDLHETDMLPVSGIALYVGVIQ